MTPEILSNLSTNLNTDRSLPHDLRDHGFL